MLKYKNFKIYNEIIKFEIDDNIWQREVSGKEIIINVRGLPRQEYEFHINRLRYFNNLLQNNNRRLISSLRRQDKEGPVLTGYILENIILVRGCESQGRHRCSHRSGPSTLKNK